MNPEFLSLKPFAKTDNAAGAASGVAFLVFEDKELPKAAQELDALAGGLVAGALNTQGFEGKKGQVASAIAPAGLGYERILLLGLGKADDISALLLEQAGGHLTDQANKDKLESVTLCIDKTPAPSLKPGEASARIALGVGLKSYNFDKYFTTKKADEKPSLKNFAIATVHPSEAEEQFKPLSALLEGTRLTRNVVTEPANVIYPESYKELCETLAADGVEVEVLNEKDMHQLGMGALLGVGQGSIRDSYIVIMKWNGADDKNEQPLAFVGKGVTFDTGGISIKPSANMGDMKYDMGGSGVVVGLMRTLAQRKAKANVIGVVGLVENMPDGNAQRPGDVVTSMSGQTIEVLNTDAEGRLVLADALWYTQDRFKPKFMINLATLTGAIVVALGHEHAGLFSNDDTLSEQLAELGSETGEKVWRFPLSEAYDKQINSDIADMKNIGEGRGAGSITAGQFLQRFVNDVPWVHLDIAGVTWADKPLSTVPKGASAFGVKLLNALVEKHYEE